MCAHAEKNSGRGLETWIRNTEGFLQETVHLRMG